MENAVEALKIAFAVLMFILALSLSISSFSQARMAVDATIELRDRDAQYVYLKKAEERHPEYNQDIYIEPTSEISRIVGIESVVSTIYRAFEEDIVVYFFEKVGENDLQPIDISYKTRSVGYPGAPDRKVEFYKDDLGQKVKTNIVDQDQGYHPDEVNAFLDILIGGTYDTGYSDEIEEIYGEIILNDEGLYEKFKDARFEELLGQYEQSEGTSHITRRVVTYIMNP